MRLSRVNGGLIVAVVPLVTLLLWDLARRDADLPDPVEWPAVATLEVDRIRLVNPTDSLEARRIGNRWSLHEPFSEPADPDLIRQVLKGFADPIRPDARVADASADPRVFGFVDGERTAVELFVGEQRTLALEFGRPLAGGSTFVRELDGGDVYRARIRGRFRLDKPASAWRDHRVTGLDKGKIVSMTVETRGETWHYERRTEDWACLEKPEMILDALAVEGMARALARLRATAVVDEAPDDAFEEVVLRVEAESQEDGRRTVEFGARVEGGQQRYLRSGERVFTASASHLDSLDRRPEDLRDRDVVKLDWREVERVAVTLGDRHFVAAPTGEHSWRLLEPEGYSIDARQMGFSLDAMIELRAFELADDVDRTAAAVDDPGALQIRIDRVEAAPVRVRVGPLRGSVHHARREDRDQTYTLRVPSARSLTQGFGLRWEE